MKQRLRTTRYYSAKARAKLLRTCLVLIGLFSFVWVGHSMAAGDKTQSIDTSMVQQAALTVSAAPKAAPSPSSVWIGFALPELLGGNRENILLSDADTENYRRIFALQDDAEWSKADAAIAKLRDKRLLGHVKAQRYLHPTAYRASYAELKNWLNEYSDFAEAGRIHSLALKRRPQGERGGLTSPAMAKGVTGGLRAAAVMGSNSHASWTAGLKAWQDKDYANAFRNFKTLARNEQANPWDQAAGAFWAARSLIRMGQPAEVSRWLSKAAAHQRTFYGLLASRQLGQDANLNFEVPELTGDHLRALATRVEGSRALALLQVGQTELAESELRNLHPKGDDTLEQALIALSAQAGLANLALRLGTAIPAPDGALYDAALYPVPSWQPEGGYSVDRALIFALVRQESRFEADARSHVGAAGLMQLMPRTASYVAGRKFDRANLAELNDPELNLTLGQKYVEYLLDHKSVGDNLFYLLAAYNSGPTQVARWKADMASNNDPLLFIETIGATETRDFIERVLANYWIYRLQMGQPTPSLDQAANGSWPRYQPQAEGVVASLSPDLLQ